MLKYKFLVKYMIVSILLIIFVLFIAILKDCNQYIDNVGKFNYKN